MPSNNEPAAPLSALQTVAARVNAKLLDDAKGIASVDLKRRWLPYVIGLAALAIALTSLVFLLLSPERQPQQTPQITQKTSVVDVHEPEVGLLAGELAAVDKAEAESENKRAAAAMKALQDAVSQAPTTEVLNMLAEAAEALEYESAVYRNTAQNRLAVIHEQLVSRVRGKDDEGAATLALARAYLTAGLRPQWLQTFQRYAALESEKARWAAEDESKSAREINQAERVAGATAFYDEVKRLYDMEDYFSVIQLNDQLITLYPQTAKAWEGLIIAARAYLANGQPSGAIDCYREVMEDCPDELFAREAAKATLKMYLYADQLDNAVAQARNARERFQDNEFKAFSLTMEGLAQERKGEASYPAAVRAFREAYAAKTGSPYAEQANEHLTELRSKMVREMNLNDLMKP